MQVLDSNKWQYAGSIINFKKVKNVSYICILFLFAGFLFISCEQWDETADISRVSYLPQFELSGGEFISVEQNEGNFTEPGVKAYVGDNEVTVNLLFGGTLYDISTNTVDLSTPGVYIRVYYAENSDGVSNTIERLVSVTHEDVTDNDLSGTYVGTLWDPQVTTRVKKINDNGLYEADEVMGFPGFSMPGRFVDIGNNELALLPDEGYFGNYGYSEGRYTNRTLSWTIYLLDAPYEGLELPVTWVKTE